MCAANIVNKSLLGIPWNDRTRLTDLDFVDDISLLVETRDNLQEMTKDLEIEAGKVGLRISTEKSKTMHIGGDHVVIVYTEC